MAPARADPRVQRAPRRAQGPSLFLLLFASFLLFAHLFFPLFAHLFFPLLIPDALKLLCHRTMHGECAAVLSVIEQARVFRRSSAFYFEAGSLVPGGDDGGGGGAALFEGRVAPPEREEEGGGGPAEAALASDLPYSLDAVLQRSAPSAAHVELSAASSDSDVGLGSDGLSSSNEGSVGCVLHHFCVLSLSLCISCSCSSRVCFPSSLVGSDERSSAEEDEEEKKDEVAAAAAADAARTADETGVGGELGAMDAATAPQAVPPPSVDPWNPYT